jgi:DNA-binding PadR family transcriptional regulator
MKTTTAEALLGVLSIKPMTGYEIREFIGMSIGNFWSESFGQIYPALKRLEAEGLIAAEAESKSEAAGVKRPSGSARRKVFALTEAGRTRLAAWLATPAMPQVPRNDLLLKLFFGKNAPPATVRALVAEERARAAADVARYEAMHPKVASHKTGSEAYFLITLSYGVAEARAIVAWCDKTLAALDAVR